MNKTNGFTLLEIIVVVVLLGIMAVGAGMLITRPIEAYNDQQRRQQLVDSAEMALRKIAIDVRNAVPNSLRVDFDEQPTRWALEIINTVDGARYRDDIDGPGGDFTDAAQLLTFGSPDNSFNLLGKFSRTLNGTYPDYRVVVFNTGNSAIYNLAAANAAVGVISRKGITVSSDPGDLGIDEDDSQRIVLTGGGHTFSPLLRSRPQRLFLTDGPISYICDKDLGRIVSFSGYPFQSNQSAIDTEAELAALGGVSVGRLVSGVTNCEITYQAGTPQRSALLTLGMTISDPEGGSVRLLHQLHVENAP